MSRNELMHQIPQQREKLIKRAHQLNADGRNHYEIAQEIGVTHQTVWRWFSGKHMSANAIFAEIEGDKNG